MTTRRVLKPASRAKPRSHPAATTGKTGSTKPGRGAVINYIYLFASEHAAGRDEGVKERPVVVVVADERGYIVVPVTTKGEIDPANSIPVPAAQARARSSSTRGTASTGWAMTCATCRTAATSTELCRQASSPRSSVKSGHAGSSRSTVAKGGLMSFWH